MVSQDYDFVILGGGPVGRYAFARIKEEFPDKTVVILDCSQSLKSFTSQTIVNSNIDYRGNEVRHSLGVYENAATWGGAMMRWPREFNYDSNLNNPKSIFFHLDKYSDLVIEKFGLNKRKQRKVIRLGNREFNIVYAEILQDRFLSDFIADADIFNLQINEIGRASSNRLKVFAQNPNTNKETQILHLPEGSRHDPCVAIRAVAVVEAMASIVIADTLLMHRLSKL